MSPDRFQNLDPAQSVKVLPRHLAGPGPTSLGTAWPFPFDEDWRVYQSEKGTAFTTSPCMRLWSSFTPEPDKSRKGAWTTEANRHGGLPFGHATWQITFDATTPVELLHDVHTELLDLYHEDLHSDRDGLFEDMTAPHEAYASLFAFGWRHHVKTDGTQSFLSPDDLAGVVHHYAATRSHEPAWRIWGGHPSEPQWQARFTTGTPTTLVAALTVSMISSEPLIRTVNEVPLDTRSHLYLATPTDTPPAERPIAQLPPGHGTGPGTSRSR
ncbi:DUF317 domain-containing protein [Streptomyces sp. NPDC059096]|uniref:DUF317 domain-containing protein n=1 Tax=Streptomyces sp. NPDC059096 TaxID=3346727 RepID=UPI0036BB9D11